MRQLFPKLTADVIKLISSRSYRYNIFINSILHLMYVSYLIISKGSGKVDVSIQFAGVVECEVRWLDTRAL